MKQKFDVKGMSCAACQAHVETAVKQVEGVCNVEVYLLSNSMKVEYDDSTSPSKIIDFVTLKCLAILSSAWIRGNLFPVSHDDIAF